MQTGALTSGGNTVTNVANKDPAHDREMAHAESATFFNEFFGNMMPPPLSKWTYDDMTKDDGFARFCFVGIGVIYIRTPDMKSANTKGSSAATNEDHRSKSSCFDKDRKPPTGAAFCLDLQWMSEYATRESFERYGATAYFNKERKPMEIHRPYAKHNEAKNHWGFQGQPKKDSNGKLLVLVSKPGDAHWEHMKWTLKVSVMTEITLIDHLLWAHLIVSNGVTRASRQELSIKNPIRQLLKPFTYRANTINFSAFKTLFAKGGMADHWFGFTREALASYMETASRSYEYKDSAAVLLGGSGLTNNMDYLKKQVPLVADGIRLHKVFLEFATSYVTLAYPEETDLTKDAEVKSYWTHVDEGRLTGEVDATNAEGGPGKVLRSKYGPKNDGKPYKFGLPALNRDSLAKQLAHVMFYVTGYHRVVGNFADYLEEGSETLACVIRPAKNEGSVMDYFGINTLAAFTGFPQINLLNDWRHVFKTEIDQPFHDEAKKEKLYKILDKWQKDLVALAETIETESLTRPYLQHMMNPRHLDVSIAI